MAQKDKVKELVGRGLHSYHTKALQQMDRIEKKNKEQNHKISILSNELDNDYLTKTEEGSVISLEHSKEGMVYLDELQGNTLVNYCTDGSKELTLNGDIDVEGTFVTTTEGVDNGLVDVMCEGNTLVNLATVKSVTLSGVGSKNISNLTFKSNTKYTIIFDVDSNNVTNESHEGIYLWLTADGTNSSKVSALDLKGRKKYVMTRSDNVNGWGIGCRNNLSGTVILNNILILEGDWTDIETPPYFIGMKSVGQDDENGHKIEILSQNKNYIDLTKKIDTSNGAKMVIEDDVVTLTSIGSYSWCYNGIKLNHLKPNTKYICKGIVEGGNPQSTFRVHDFNGAISTTFKNSLVFTTPSDVSKLCLLFYVSTSSPCETGETAVFKNIQLEKSENSTDYVKRQSNKKEILMNEPLRGLPNGVKDRLVRIGGKWYIERNCGKIILDGSEEDWVSIYAFSKTNVFRKPLLVAKNTITDYETVVNNFLVDKLPIVKYSTYDTTDAQTVSFSSLFNSTYNGTAIYINRNSSSDLVSFKQWLSENPITVIYELATPIYEPLEIEPTLNTYTDTTHISNNSIIPCNMKVQNSGYNAIIKPSTLYTVALDTNKSGTIGMNLGGAKGTTTNNVATITTPATLTDDSLRLYGKGIKGSKVRLLEGDKTNWIPSHFEGMKSSFEDKFDATDNTYKMEILSNNKNLFDGNWTRIGNSKQHETSYIKVSPNSNYIFSVSDNYNTNSAERRFNVQFYDKHKNYLGFIVTGYLPNNVKINTPYNCKYIKIITRANTDFTGEYTNIEYCDVQLEKGMEVTSYVSPKSNKIQFSSIEPLRGVGNIKDKFIFKDGKLMIERNIKSSIIDGTEGVVEIHGGNKCMITKFVSVMNNGIDYTPISCDKLQVYTGRDIMVSAKNVNGICYYYEPSGSRGDSIVIRNNLINQTVDSYKEFLLHNPLVLNYIIKEPTYEEVPFELAKIILEGYENGTLFFDTNIPPTSKVTYAGETPIVSAIKSNKLNVVSNTQDINDNIIPYLMDMDYRVVCLQLESNIEGISMARLFGGVYEMLKRDILSSRYSIDEYKHRLDVYLSANKITEEEYNKLGDMLNE